MNMVTRGKLRSTRSMAGGRFRLATVSMVADSPDFVDHFQVHGLESRPRANADVLVFAASGNAEHLVSLIAGTSQLVLADGEAALYNDFGWSAQLKETQFEIVKSGTSRVKVTQTAIDLGTSPSQYAARVSDSVALDVSLGSWAAQVVAAVNTLSSGAIVITGAPTGTITGGSTKVRIE